MEGKILRTGCWAIVCALCIRLLDIWSPSFALSPELGDFMFFLQTGRVIRHNTVSFSPPPETPLPEESEPSPPEETEPDRPVFSPQDAETLAINSSFSHGADIATLLTKPLSWDLTGDKPTVLILHSHATESFAPNGAYHETSPYRTLDTGYNMVAVGAYVAQRLTEGGLTVLHDTTLHDSPSYNASYNNSRKSVQTYLEEYPSIRLVLDLHRDAYEDAQGNPAALTVFSQGETAAALMFVVGTNVSGLEHPNWQENLSLALKLQTQIETLCPGICRSVNLRTQRFNQDLSAGSLLVEVGASGNSLEEALRAAEILAQGILSLAHGSL